MQFITTDQRIAVENFEIGLIYTVTFTGGRYFSGACIGKGADFVMFQRTAPELVYCLNMTTAEDVESIEQTGGGSGTLNYNDLYNKPQINGVELVGNKSSSELGLLDPTALTPLQAALAELVDSGSKNILQNTAYTREVNGVSYTVNADGSVRVVSAGDNTLSQLYLVRDAANMSAGSYILSGSPAGSTTTYDLRIVTGGRTTINHSGGSAFTADGSTYTVSIIVRAAQVLDITINPMICSAAAWAISQTFKPYTPTLYELYQMIQG